MDIDVESGLPVHASRLRKQRLVPASLAPPWTIRDHILSYYRPKSGFKTCVTSLWEIHNETGNIWSHVIGTLVFSSLLVDHLSELEQHYADYILGILLLTACTVCMTSSAVYHLFMPLSDETHASLLRCDLVGISSMVAGGWFPGVYYGFACFPNLRRIWFMISSVLVISSLFWPHMRFASKTKYDAAFYCTMAGLGVAPLAQWAYMLGGIKNPEVQEFLLSLLGVLLCGCIGFFFYASKIPESLAPGRFDVWGNSHTFWHLSILAGGIQAYRSMIRIQHWRELHPCVAAF